MALELRPCDLGIAYSESPGGAPKMVVKTTGTWRSVLGRRWITTTDSYISPVPTGEILAGLAGTGCATGL